MHGCIAPLRTLVSLIEADAAAIEGERWIVLVGDYVDRGPDSAAVLDWLCAPPPDNFRRVALAGNHEEMMLDFIDRPRGGHLWLRNGGEETLRSYGIDPKNLFGSGAREVARTLAAHLPEQHVQLLRDMPLSLSVPGTVFVHAGWRRNLAVADQNERELLWGGAESSNATSGESSDALRVVHGHTPLTEPLLLAERVCVDTGAFATGRLTAARLTADGACTFLSGSAEA